MINREGILKELGVFFDAVYTDKTEEELYYAYISKRGLNRGRFNGYVFHMTPVDRMTDEEIYWFASYEKTKINLENYFSSEEIKQYAKSKVKTKTNLLPVVFENVLPISDDQWVTTINTKVLYELYNNSLLAYNIRTQRSPKVYYKDGREAYKININRRSVKEIRDLIERGLFISNDLSFNVGGRAENDFYYDEQKASFVLKSGTLDILDGFHRIMAIIQVMHEDPEIEREFVLNIMNFSEDKARRFVAQQDKRNKINTSFSRSLDDTKFESNLVKRLNEDTNCVLFGQIKTVGKREIDFGRTANMIKFFYNPRSMHDVIVMEKEIADGFNIVSQYKDANVLTDKEFKIALAYIRYSNSLNENGYKNFKKYLDKHEDEAQTFSKLRRAAKTAVK